MKPSFALLSAALLTTLFAAPADAGTETLFEENFIHAGGSWTGTAKFTSAANADAIDNQGWSFGASTYVGPSSMRLGSTSVTSDATTPSIARQNKRAGAKVTLSFLAASRNTGNGRLSVDVLDEDGNVVSTPVDSVSMKKLNTDLTNLDSSYSSDNSDSPLSFQFETPDPFSLVFRNVNSTLYVLVDSILVTDFVPDALPTPATLAVSGVVGANDFSVEWASVADANGYSVKLLDPNENVVSSNDVQTTTASFSGLTSSTEYTVVVVALGNYTTTDDSLPKTLAVTTDASGVAAPTLVVANTSWTAGVAGTSAVTATLEGDVACTVESATMSDGSTATVANGTLSWTPPAANAASSVTATFHVTHGNDGWDIPQVLSVAATPAPAAPSLVLSNATASSFDASWQLGAGGPVVEYKVRAWTGRAMPDDATGSATEMFTNWYNQDLTLPSGWSKEGSLARYAVMASPVSFNESNQSLTSPVFPGTIERISFVARRYSAKENNPSTLSVYASSGADGSEWTLIRSIDLYTEIGTSGTEFAIDLAPGFHQFKFSYQKDAGNCGFGTFSVSGTDWPAADFLEGWGGAKVSVGTATSQTFSNPVPGTANYVEVTAFGPTGLAASTIESISIPRTPAVVISVK